MAMGDVHHFASSNTTITIGFGNTVNLVRLGISIAGLWAMFPCFLVLLKFRLYRMQAERHLLSLLVSSALLNVSLASLAMYQYLGNAIDTRNKSGICGTMAMVYGAMYGNVIFEGFTVVYTYHVLSKDRLLLPSKEVKVRFFCWGILALFMATSMICCMYTCDTSGANARSYCVRYLYFYHFLSLKINFLTII